MMTNPTAVQAEQCCIVQNELLETINRLIAEGIDYRVVLAGAGAAVAATVYHHLNGEAVSIWFAQQSALTMHFATKG